ncbi:MAG: hypothetical protein GX610_12825 [Rhodococcus sp.]|nr:hypothetical protein [Rhodococcus sp. (in: high G+C Gram-positive bacteria)]
MNGLRTLLCLGAALALAMAAAVMTPAVASADTSESECALPLPFYSGSRPQGEVFGYRVCETSTAGMQVWTLGHGPVCGGVVGVGLVAYDGRLIHAGVGSPFYTIPEPNLPHSVQVTVQSGQGLFDQVSDVSILACRVTATVHWTNLDTGATGVVSQLLTPFAPEPPGPPDNGYELYLHTGQGRVQITVTTNFPHLAAETTLHVP